MTRGLGVGVEMGKLGRLGGKDELADGALYVYLDEMVEGLGNG
jgi:hypothetical protein